MKRKFTFLIAALMLLTMISHPTRLWGQTKTDPTVTFSYTVYNGQGTSGTGSPCSASSDGVSIASTIAYGASGHVKEYSGSQLTFSSSVGNITSIAITTSQNVNNVGLVSGQPGSVTVSGSVATWSGDAASVKLYNKGSGQFRWTQIVVTYEASTTYTITCATGLANGSIASNVSEAAENDDVTITATPSSGYKLSTVTVTKDGGGTVSNTITGNTATFKMPAYNVTVTAAFVQCHTVTCATGLEHGSISADMATAAVGETVTITASPSDGYYLSAITVTNVDSDEIIIDGNTAMFEMPDSNVTVSATFTAKTTYVITRTVTPENSGTITADADAWEGKTVNVSVSPAAGYIYSSIAIKKTGDASTTITPGGNATDGFTFTMPAYAVTITATFATADIYAKYSGDLTEGDYIISSTGNMALSNTYSSNRFSGISISPSSNQIINPASSIVWHISSSGSYWTIYDATNSKYVTGTGTKSQAGYVATPSDNKELWTITETSSGTYRIVNNYNSSQSVNADLKWGGDYWACYAATGSVYFYKKVVTSAMTVASVGNGTITATPAGGSAIAEDGSTTVSSGTTVTLSATGEGSYVLDAWNVYKTGDESTKVTVTSNTFTMPDYGVTVNASFRLPTTFTVHYSVNGSIDPGLTQSDIEEGNSVTLRTSGDVTLPLPSGYAFAGWTENAATGELISGGTYTPTDNTTLYLVFIKSGETLGYNKVTSLENITEGTYIIVNDNYCLPSVSTGSTTAPAKSNDYKVTNASSTSTYTSVPANTEWIFTGSNTAMTITNSEGKYLYEINDNNGVRVHTTSDTWAFELNTSAPCYAMKGANNKRYCATYTSDWRSYTTKDYTNYNDGGRLYLYKKTPVYTLVKTISGSESMTNIEKTYIITVANGGVLTLSGTNNANAAHLIIENGGQLITNNAVQATVKKNITGYGNDDNVQTGWYTIVSPLTANYTPAGVMLENTYDLYYYDEEGMSWRNYKQTGGDHYHFDMIPEQGYLYANSATTTLSFAGDVLASDATVTKTLSFAATNDNVKGFNLMGNPFTCNITNSSNVTIGGAPFSAYYIADGTVKEGKNLIPYTISDREIKPCEGFIVQATASQDLVFNPADPGKRGETANKLSYIRIEAGNSDFMDRAYVQVGQGNTLRKMSINDNVSKVYVMNDGKDYAAVTIKEAQGEMPVNFRANENGEYTLTVNVENVEMSYLHLIDNMTGADVDLLQTPSYSFTSKTTDYASRFRLVFSANSVNDDSTNSETFAFINGEEIVITNAEADATLQVVDMTGRILVNTKGANRLSTAGMTPGVYVIRMVNGEKVKTQKIVVR